MRWTQVSSGIYLVTSNEENDLCEFIRQNKSVELESLNERQQELSRKLVSRGVLNLFVHEEIDYVVNNDLVDLYRDRD